MKPYLVIQLILLSAVGVLLIVFGLLLWIGKKISLIHEYHYRNVRPKDIPVYTRLMGIALLVFGAALVATGVLNALFDTSLGWIAFAVGMVVFFLLANHAQNTYNGSWFG